MVKAIRLVCRAISFRSPYLVASAEGTPVPSIQSIQITAPQGSNLNTVELLVGGEIAAQSSIVQTDEHVSTLEIPSDVGDLSQSAQLDVLIAGPASRSMQRATQASTSSSISSRARRRRA